MEHSARHEGWRERAACRNHDPDDFFPAGSPHEVALATDAALAICRFCPLTARCLRLALLGDEPDGIWGGMTPRERADLSRGQRTAA